MKTIFQNIKQLVQIEEHAKPFVAGQNMSTLISLSDAYLIVRDELIEDFGLMKELKPEAFEDDDLITEVDCTGKLILPAYCDSHTHLVYPAGRETEFVDRIKGYSYEKIAKRGGGILNSANSHKDLTEGQLLESALVRINEIISQGTGAVEIKSGYGLSVQEELKLLRVINRLKMSVPVKIKTTFLGAHAIPDEYRNNRQGYIDLVINEMIPAVADEELADYIDVFCDKGFFTITETDQILKAGIKYGLKPKIHANELALSGGVQVGVKYNALSVDHLEYIEDDEIKVLLGSETMPTILPGAAFFLNLPLSPVRKMIDAGLPVALASDYNPGSSPSGNMNFIQSLACLRYNMLPEEAINAVTLNSAYAMGIEKTHGSIAIGKCANLFITKEISSYLSIPYYFGTNPVESIMLNGEFI